jgi:putative oxidoreductase
MARNLEARLSTHSPQAVAVFRVVFGLLFLCQGLTKLIGWPNVAYKAPVGEWPFYYAGWIELVTSVLIIAGLFTRQAAFIACGEMAFAYFTHHLPHGLVPMTNGGELAVLYCFAFLLLIFIGGGAYALDTRRPAGGWQLTRTPWVHPGRRRRLGRR